MSMKTGEDLIAEAKQQIAEVTPAQARELKARDESVVCLDVREANEWNLGRIPGAIHLPRGNLESKVESVLGRDQPIVVYCARGNRSALAALTMKQMGYEKVWSLAGGLAGWVDANGEIED